MKSPLVGVNREKGFTIIELIIATGVFSVMMLVLTAGVINFTNQYYKGVITSNTQNTGRAIMSEITQAIQFGGAIQTNLTDGANTEGFCVDGKLYSYVIGQQVSDRGANATQHQAYHAFVADTNTGTCDATTQPLAIPTTANLGSGQRELLGDRMRLGALNISTDDNSVYTVHLRIIYGEDDLLAPDVSVTPVDWSKETCKSAAGSQYCAYTDLTTTVQKRI